jgi:hypothetical protein
MNQVVNFPPGIPEDTRIQVCKMLEEKDQELSSAYKEIVVLENKLERFNGSLTWSESENLKTRMAINDAIVTQLYEGLGKFHLRAVQYEDNRNPNKVPIRIEKIPMLERLTTWLKSLIKFKIVKTS